MPRGKYASCDESPLNTAFRAFVILRCATDTHDTHRSTHKNVFHTFS